ncbi:MAG TPA: hypothetical protein VM901_10700 [Bdellovibrionota bacterium]|nr:hypothetical protein [Bdellovibrionota bacterium]
MFRATRHVLVGIILGLLAMPARASTPDFEARCHLLIDRLHGISVQETFLAAHQNYRRVYNDTRMRLGAEEQLLDQAPKMLTGSVVSFGSGVDVFRPFIDFPLAREVHLIEGFDNLDSRAIRAAVLEIHRRLLHLTPNVQVQWFDRGFSEEEVLLGNGRPVVFKIMWRQDEALETRFLYVHAANPHSDRQMNAVLDSLPRDIDGMIVSGGPAPRRLRQLVKDYLRPGGKLVLETNSSNAYQMEILQSLIDFPWATPHMISETMGLRDYDRGYESTFVHTFDRHSHRRPLVMNFDGEFTGNSFADLTFTKWIRTSSLRKIKPLIDKSSTRDVLLLGQSRDIVEIAREHPFAREIHFATGFEADSHSSLAASLHSLVQNLDIAFPLRHVELVDGGFAGAIFGNLDFLFDAHPTSRGHAPQENFRTWEASARGDYDRMPLRLRLGNQLITVHYSTRRYEPGVNTLEWTKDHQFGAIYIMGQGEMLRLPEILDASLLPDGFAYLESFAGTPLKDAVFETFERGYEITPLGWQDNNPKGRVYWLRKRPPRTVTENPTQGTDP